MFHTCPFQALLFAEWGLKRPDHLAGQHLQTPFPKALAALVSRKIQVAPLIGEILPLTDGLSAFEKAGRPGSLKIVLKNS